MIKSLWAMFSKKQPAAVARKSPRSGADFRAVSIASSSACCSAAKSVTGARYLMREAPRLPLVACSMPESCACKFRKVSDRRDGDRRLFGGTATNSWYSGKNQRNLKSRRSTII